MKYFKKISLTKYSLRILLNNLEIIGEKIDVFLLKNSKLSKILNHKFIHFFIAISSFYILFLMSLAKGGRWDMYEPIAVADRFFSQAYSMGRNDNFIPSTPYYPAVSIIAFIVNFISSKYQVEIMLFVSVGLIFVLLYILHKFFKEIGGKADITIFISLSLGLLLFFFKNYIVYAIEFKPDTLALIFMMLAYITILKGKYDLRSNLFIILFIFIASISKQQIIAPIIGIAIYIIISKENIKNKLTILFSIFAGVFLANIFIFTFFEGSFFYAFKSHMGRKLIYKDFYENHKFFLISISLLFFVSIILNKEFKKNFLKNITKFIPAFLFIIAGILGAINMGGNNGNTEVGFILILPILIMSFDCLKKFLILLILIYFSFYNINKIYNNDYYSLYQNRLNLENTISKKIKLSGLNSILISGDSYIATKKSNIKKISEIDVWSHISIGINQKLVHSNINDLIKDLDTDIVLCIQGCSAFELYPTKFGYKEIKIDDKLNQILFFKKNK